MTKRKLSVLHAAVSMNPSFGVVKQMEWEQQAAHDLNIMWKVTLHTSKNIESEVVVNYKNLPNSQIRKYISLRLNFYRWLRKVEKDYDLIILRHSVHDVFEASFARDFGYKLLTVHHTLEIPEILSLGGVVNYCKSSFERVIGNYCIKNSSGVIGVTEEIVVYEKQRTFQNKSSFVYPNGISCRKKILLDSRQEMPEVVFIAANFSPWHGLDLLIDEAEVDNSKCLIHIIGNVPLALVVRCQKDDRFVLHGSLSSEQMNKLIERAWCGLSSFALFRNKMNDACTLKVREYLDAGLPVFSGHRDSGLPQDFPYYQIDKPKINKILSFAKFFRDINRHEISNASEIYISKKILLRKLYSDLQSLEN